jgi:hypothetical protein
MTTSPTTASPVVEKLLPENPGASGWYLVGERYSYIRDNLYNYINGAADMFISYGFLNLAGAVYSFDSMKKSQITVDLYDMGNKLNAFGIFCSKKDPEAESLEIGADASGGENYIFFYKDRFYVEIQGFFSKEMEKTAVKKIAQKTADRIAGDCRPPHELGYLPETGRIAGSEMYITGGVLGHAFLDRGLVCDYKTDGEVSKAFVVFFSSEMLATDALRKYKKYLIDSGEMLQVLPDYGKRGFVAKEPYHKTVMVVQENSFIVGVYDLSNTQSGKKLLGSLVQKVGRPLITR